MEEDTVERGLELFCARIESALTGTVAEAEEGVATGSEATATAVLSPSALFPSAGMVTMI